MRVLMISDVYFPRINGVSTSIQTFRRGLHAAGHETILIAPEYPGGSRPTGGRHPASALALRAARSRRPADEARRDPCAAAALERSFDLVHIQTPFIAHYQGTTLARALRVPGRSRRYHTYFEEYLHHYVPLCRAR